MDWLISPFRPYAPQNSALIDPLPGTGTLLMALAHQIGEDRCTIFSQDIFRRSNKMLKLNLILNGLVSSIDHAIQGDILTSPYHKSDDDQQLRHFDFVVSNPHSRWISLIQGKRLRRYLLVSGLVFHLSLRKKESMAIYACFIQHVVNSLKKNGKGAIVVPTGFLTAKEQR